VSIESELLNQKQTLDFWFYSKTSLNINYLHFIMLIQANIVQKNT